MFLIYGGADVWFVFVCGTVGLEAGAATMVCWRRLLA
jgi:hypothetical protein